MRYDLTDPFCMLPKCGYLISQSVYCISSINSAEISLLLILKEEEDIDNS